MPADDATAIEADRAAEQQAQADFESGMPSEPATTMPAAGATPDTAKPDPAPKPDTKPAVAKPEAAVKPPEPKYVRLTEDQFATLNAAAAKTASFEGQLSKAFGTIGNMQKVLTGLQSATPRGGKIEIPKDAFAGMERDFPELAEHTRAALEATLRGLTGTGPAGAEIDPELMKRLVTEHATQARTDAEIEALEDEFPDWRKIVGQVDISKQQPDAANPFRKWLATKDAAYQARLNSTNSAAVISRAIRTFQAEAKAPAAATPTPSLKAQLQAARIRGAVQPRGDGGQAAPAPTGDAEFEAGFASG
jgi:hypothetical protein